MIKKRLHILSVVFLLIPVLGKSQYKSYWDVEPNIGINFFFGDLDKNRVDSDSGFSIGYGVKVGRQFSYVFGLEFSFLYGKLSGNNSHNIFVANYIETVLNGKLNITNLFTWDKRSDRKFNFYLIGGIGYSHHNTKMYEISTGKLLRSVGYGNGAGFGGRTLEGIYLYGISLEYNISKNFAVNVRTVNRAMNSDFFDGSPTGYHKDSYNYTSVSFVWKFGLIEDHKRHFRKKHNNKSGGSRNNKSKYNSKLKNNNSTKKAITDESSYDDIGNFNAKKDKVIPIDKSVKADDDKNKTGKKRKNKLRINRYNGYEWKKGQGWLKKRKNKKDKYDKFRNEWK